MVPRNSNSFGWPFFHDIFLWYCAKYGGMAFEKLSWPFSITADRGIAL